MPLLTERSLRYTDLVSRCGRTLISYQSSIHLYMSLISIFVVLYCKGPMGRQPDGYMGSRSHLLLVVF